MSEHNPTVVSEFRDLHCRITLNRPERFNAMTIPMMRRLRAAFEEAGAAPDCRCVVLQATGRGFCTGQDLQALTKLHEHQPPAAISEVLRCEYNPVISAITDLRIPVIAAIQGVAAGAGWSLALACDLRVAAKSARFVPAFSRLGLAPDLGGPSSLVEAAGYARAVEFCLLRNDLTATEAEAWGLINAVVEDAALGQMVDDWVQRIVALPRAGVAQTKQLLRDAAGHAQMTHLQAEAWAQAIAASDPAHQEALNQWRTSRTS